MEEIFKQIISVNKVSEVVKIIEMLQNSMYKKCLKWIPVGGVENNLGIISMGSNGASAVIERVTNAIDAVLEREWVERNKPQNIETPREAVEKWFNIKDGHLKDIDKYDENLTSKIKVTYFDSDCNSKPTIEIRDKGIGIESSNFSETILSLNGSNKLGKLFLSGAYGQGGSTALSFSEYTLIISRRIRSKNVAFTIVRYNLGDTSTDKHGKYEYMIDSSTGMPLKITVNNNLFEEGTMVKHIAMDVGKFNGVMTAPTNSLWYLAHHYLFDPILPFQIYDGRISKSTKNAKRNVAGNYRLLCKSDNTEYQRKGEFILGDGRVKITWWVLKSEDKKEKIKHYTLPSKPIIITHNGQKQGELSNSIIKDNLRLPYLDKYIVVHIDCDNIDNESKRRLFSSTRETLKNGNLTEELKEILINALSNDEELKRINNERKRQLLTSGNDDTEKELVKRLSDRLSKTIALPSLITSPKPKSSVPTPKIKTPIISKEPPTFIKITNKDPIEIYSEKVFAIHFETDANESYFRNNEVFNQIITPSKVVIYNGKTNMNGGRGIIYFQALKDIQLKDKAKIKLQLKIGSKVIEDKIDIIVIQKKEEVIRRVEKLQEPNIKLHWIDDSHKHYIGCDWDKDSVVEVIEDDEEIDVFISAVNKNYINAIEKYGKKNTDKIEKIKNFYEEQVAYYALLYRHLRLKNKAKDEDLNNEEAAEKEEDCVQYQCIADTVCGIIGQLHDIFL
ncbi:MULTISPECIES: hypothetical protein [unclassified Clostridium]|uniref:hypothetical protein n=1 Tax=unclassified Clostridium TaxID=2614128 RepID=UPI003216382B